MLILLYCFHRKVLYLLIEFVQISFYENWWYSKKVINKENLWFLSIEGPSWRFVDVHEFIRVRSWLWRTKMKSNKWIKSLVSHVGNFGAKLCIPTLIISADRETGKFDYSFSCCGKVHEQVFLMWKIYCFVLNGIFLTNTICSAEICQPIGRWVVFAYLNNSSCRLLCFMFEFEKTAPLSIIAEILLQI